MSTRREEEAPDPERARAILAERARLLARPVATERRDERTDAIVFVLSGESYALEARAVREVVRFTDFTVVPGAPDVLLGVTNLRGEILPVFDLRRLIGVARDGLTDLSRLLVLGDEREEIGLLADEVRGTRRLSRADVLDAPDSLAALGRAAVAGVTRDAVIVLDGAAILRDARLEIGEQEGAMS